MAKKKKTNRKQRRAPVVSRTATSDEGTAEASAPTAAIATAKPALSAVTSPAKAPAISERWQYVGRDIRRIGGLVGVCILAELVLWFALKHTGLGSHIYGVIKP